MVNTRSTTRQNSYGPLSVVAARVLSGTPVSRNRPRNAMTVASIRRLIVAHPNLYRQYGHIFRANNPSPRVINLHRKTNIGKYFHSILRNARIKTYHRDGSITFKLVGPPERRRGVPAGNYKLHPSGHITGPGGFVARFTGGNRGFMLANINRS
jgi:hypothetical protein